MKGASEGDGAVKRDPLWSPSLNVPGVPTWPGASLPIPSALEVGGRAAQAPHCLSRLTSILSAAYPLANADMHISVPCLSVLLPGILLPAPVGLAFSPHMCPLKGPDLTHSLPGPSCHNTQPCT